jgi:putative iron-regulated protein
MRYYDGPIDGPESAARAAGPEGRLNAWPLNEAVIDYVEGDADAGLVHELATPITRDTILSRDQVSDEADVTTGWHAIEFLLWGQDRSADGPGARPAADYLPGDPARDRRRAYLGLLADQLVDDLRWLEGQWNADQADAYVHFFLALEQHEAIGRVLTGAANLAGHELASERLAVALDSGAQEDEQSCFSDSTRQDFVFALDGIRQAWYGRDGRGLASVLKPLRPALAAELDARFARAEAAIAALPQPFDRMLNAAPDSAERQAGENAVTALQELGAGLRDAGTALGVLVIVSGV